MRINFHTNVIKIIYVYRPPSWWWNLSSLPSVSTECRLDFVVCSQRAAKESQEVFRDIWKPCLTPVTEVNVTDKITLGSHFSLWGDTAFLWLSSSQHIALIQSWGKCLTSVRATFDRSSTVLLKTDNHNWIQIRGTWKDLKTKCGERSWLGAWNRRHAFTVRGPWSECNQGSLNTKIPKSVTPHDNIKRY